jgi:TPR repeat protein
VALAALLLIYLSQGLPQPAPNSPPPKPLRERLLDRALKGDTEAQFDLGKNYETGRIGLPKDMSQALHWYREAAAHGEPFAEASLGILYHFGKGVKQDEFEACVWYERAVLHLTGGDRDSVIELRDRAGRNLSPAQREKAQNLARNWKPTSGQ